MRSLQIRRVLLDTSNDPKHARAIAMYERFGFKLEGTLPDYYQPGESMVIFGLTL